jgi:hypothetical protein
VSEIIRKSGRRKSKNRYALNAKLSEYRLLKALRSFVDHQTPAEAAKSTRISERTLRVLFKQLRRKLVEAMIAEPMLFAGLGFFLFEDGTLRERGHVFFDILRTHPAFTQHLSRMGARPRDAEAAALHLFEVAARLFVTLSIPRATNPFRPKELAEAEASHVRISAWLDYQERLQKPSSAAAEVAARFEEIREAFPRFVAVEESRNLIANATFHRYPHDALYHDMRRYLLKHPIR